MPNNGDQARGKPKGGRPRRSAAQKAAAKERRIEPSFQGRLRFRPGDPHKLDVQIREARNYSALLAEQIAQLQAILAALNEMDDPSVMVSREENALKVFLWQEYQNHKHRDHIAATFLAIRRQRLLARLQAAGEALQVAQDLLRPDDILLKELRAAVDHQRQEAERRKQQPLTQPPSNQGESPATQEQGSQAQDDQRQQSPPPGQADEAAQQQQSQAQGQQGEGAEDSPPPSQQANNAAANPQQQEEGEKDPPQIDSRHIYGDVAKARARLATFEAQVQQMRGAISPAIGWFEVFYVKKTRYTAAAREYLKKDRPIPDDVEAMEDVWYGPYLKYRWQEATGGPMYTIQMGLIPEEERAAAEQWAAILQQAWPNESGDPWSSL